MDRGPRIQVDIALKLGVFELEVDFASESGVTVLFGHSGSGKSLTLRAIAGLRTPDSGRILVGGTVFFDSAGSINVPAHERPIGLVMQDSALLPHLSVRANVEFSIRGSSREQRRQRADDILALMGMTAFAQRKPGTLSGGQRQRVSLARALSKNSRVLLLDEPFSALDDALRVTLRKELLRLQAELGLTIIFVTHDLREAHLLADRLAVFDDGRILQLGSREDVFKRPASRRVAELTGTSNIFSATVVSTVSDGLFLDVDGLRLQADGLDGRFVPGAKVDAAIRADRINLRRGGEVRNGLLAVVSEEFAFGNNHTLHLTPVGPGPAVEVEIASRPYEVLGVKAGQEWLLEIPPGDLHVMPSE